MDKSNIGKDFIEHKLFKTQERKTLSNKGEAMPDGSFPIRNTADLKRAIQAFGRAKNKPKARAWIIRRARELNATDLLPDGWADTKQSFPTWQEFLAHHGVKGQKWGVRRSRRSLRKAAEKRGSNPTKDLSNEELQQLVTRMNLEQQYSRLTGGNQRSLAARGAGFAASIAANIARTQLTNAANAQIAKALSRR